MSKTFKHIIVGGGNAAGYAAREYMQQGGVGKNLCIIGREAVVSYERPALTKGFLAPSSPARLPGFHTCVGTGNERQDSEWYTNNGITFLTSTSVESLNPETKCVTTSRDEKLYYEDAVVLATGARARTLVDIKMLPEDKHKSLTNVHYVREVEEATTLYSNIEKASNIVIMGGGYIGMEVAAMAIKFNKNVTIVYPTEHLMANFFPPTVAKFYEEHYTSNGITLMPGNSIKDVEIENETLTKAVLGDGSKLDLDLLIVGIGGIPNDDTINVVSAALEKSSSGGGYTVDHTGCTSVPGVYAMGDIASFNGKRRCEHVDNARKSAAHVIQQLLSTDKTKEYEYLPYFYSRVFDLQWKFYGETSDNVVTFNKSASGTGTQDDKKAKVASTPGAYWLNADKTKVIGVFLESGSDAEYEAIKAAVNKNLEISTEELAKQGLDFCL